MLRYSLASLVARSSRGELRLRACRLRVRDRSSAFHCPDKIRLRRVAVVFDGRISRPTCRPSRVADGRLEGRSC